MRPTETACSFASRRCAIGRDVAVAHWSKAFALQQSSKQQAPTSREIPNSKLQIPKKSQIKNPKSQKRFRCPRAIWNLELGVSLELGACCGRAAATEGWLLFFTHHFLYCCWIIQQKPFNDRNGQAAVLDQIVMELTEPEIFAVLIFVTAEQIHDLPFADDVADLLMWT